MKITHMKQLRSVSRSVKVFNMTSQYDYLKSDGLEVVKKQRVTSNKWVLSFLVMHNNTLYNITYMGVMGTRLTSQIDWLLDDIIVVRSGKQMRKREAFQMLDDLFIRGQVKTFDTSDIVCNYLTANKYSSFASVDYNGKLYYLVRSDSGLVKVVTSKGHALFVADTIKEAKIGIKQTCINQNK